MAQITRKGSRAKDSFLFSDEEAHEKIKEIMKMARKVEKTRRDGEVPDYSSVTANFDREYINELIFYTLQSSSRTNEEIKFLAIETMEIRFFKELIQNHGHNYHEMCCKYMTYEFVEKGQNVFEYGTIGSKFYIIIQGRVGIVIPIVIAKPNGEEERIMKEVKELNQGEAFGELALLSKKPRAATIYCKEECHFAVLEDKHFKMILSIKGDIEEKKLEKSINFFQKLDIFKDWTFNQLKTLYLRFSEVIYKTKDVVFHEGDPSNDIYFIKTGEFLLSKQESFEDERVNKNAESKLKLFLGNVARKKKSLQLAILAEGELIGEDDAYNNKKRSYDVKCLSHEGILYKLDKKEFLKKVRLYERSYQILMRESQEKTERYRERIIALKQTKVKLYKQMYDLRRIFEMSLATPRAEDLTTINQAPSTNDSMQTISNHRKSVSELSRPQTQSLPFSKHFSTKDEKVFKNMKKRAEFALFKNIESQIITANQNNSHHPSYVSKEVSSSFNTIYPNTTTSLTPILPNQSGIQISNNNSLASLVKHPNSTTHSLIDTNTPLLYFSNHGRPSKLHSEIPSLGSTNNEKRASTNNLSQSDLRAPRKLSHKQTLIGMGVQDKHSQMKFLRGRQEAINQEVIVNVSSALLKSTRKEEFEKEKPNIEENISFLRKLFPTHEYLFRKNKEENHLPGPVKHNNLNPLKHLSDFFGAKMKPKISSLPSPKIAEAFRDVKNRRFREMLSEI